MSVMKVQGELFGCPARPQAVIPDLASYDWILINTSGGKDSQAAMDVVVQAARMAGVLNRVVSVHCDLGEDEEWEGVAELAAGHAAHYGLRHEQVCRMVPGPDGQLAQQALSEYIEAYGRWPRRGTRYCTSEFKRAPVRKLMTQLARETRATWGPKAARSCYRRVRILNVMGLRALESTDRAAMTPFSPDEDASNLTVRHVDEWLPIHGWAVREVWARIAQAGTRPHPIYTQGMPRLSCKMCVLAGNATLVLAAQLDPAAAAAKAAMEQRMGDSFKHGTTMAQIIERARATPRAAAVAAAQARVA